MLLRYSVHSTSQGLSNYNNGLWLTATKASEVSRLLSQAVIESLTLTRPSIQLGDDAVLTGLTVCARSESLVRVCGTLRIVNGGRLRTVPGPSSPICLT